MREQLHRAMGKLAYLMEDRSRWRSVDVTYHPPHVERLWTQVGDSRLMLHTIHPCKPGEALGHPHPWPSAVHVASGMYEHEVGVCSRVGFSPLYSERVVAGSEYEMTKPHTWHSVRPYDRIVHSVMLVGKPYDLPEDHWSEFLIRPDVKQGPLSPERFDELFERWQFWANDHLDQVDPPVECTDCPWEGRASQLAPNHEIVCERCACPECGCLHIVPRGRRE